MEPTTDKLEAKFQKAEADIDYISRKLECEFTSESADGAGNTTKKKNPAQILQKLGKIKEQYAAIVQEAEAIKQAQLEAMEFFRGELTSLCEKLMALQTQIEPGEEGTTVDSCEAGAAAAVASSSSGVKDQNSAGTSEVKTTTPERSLPEQAPVSPYERRKDCQDQIDIDNDEFMSVSSLVRGRVKLVEVNQTYRILWHHFKEEGNSDELTSAEMFKMGLRVTGQTGEAKLKVLRALKLLEISKKGNVKLL